MASVDIDILADGGKGDEVTPGVVASVSLDGRAVIERREEVLIIPERV